MKKTFLAALVAFTAAFTAPQKSEAVIIAAGRSSEPGFFALDFTDNALVNLAICVLVLPICTLDEKAPQGPMNSSAVLLANGYSPEEAQVIVRDQKYVFQALASKKLSLKMSKTDTVESLRKDLETVAPGVSNSYLNFLIQNR